jgi:hypothetical protein
MTITINHVLGFLVGFSTVLAIQIYGIPKWLKPVRFMLPNQDYKAGWIRLSFLGGLGIFFTRERPLFSERNGYTKPFMVIRQYRFFYLKPTKD